MKRLSRSLAAQNPSLLMAAMLGLIIVATGDPAQELLMTEVGQNAQGHSVRPTKPTSGHLR
ncbi:MAG: hypothetical protein IH623_13425 [Verrucomicrobia bacterium]|nr:hypothetical protein [Verrucomicrobiota bacterium]